MNQLIDYWPTLTEINQCVRTEAETADDAVLLAVHEPMLLRTREVGTGTEQAKTEEDLLKAFLSPADDGSAVVVAITGDSGVGKSHMIRWLHAQLQRHEKRDELVIVLVPKTASLRQVVELILAPLPGADYERLRQELGRVTDSLAPDAASRMLATALTIELEAREKQWMAELRANTKDQGLRERVEHARGLRRILFQDETFSEWLQPILRRIVGQALGGGSEAESGSARRFLPEDLQVPEAFDVASVSPDAQRYMLKLQGNEGAGTSVAARLLQDALDAALRSVFKFSEALGQRTIEEIVNDIRVNLLKERKELALLIEDFAALAGIQETLLSLMISESDHAGDRVRAPLRTALAVTDGFLPSRQTILTRAKREWVIPNFGNTEEEVLERLTQMAGRYINAARWGIGNLRQQFAKRSSGDLYAWVQTFDVELDAKEQEMLDAFGKSRRGDPLFPLSPLAVRALAKREMTVDGKLPLNPRKFINAVLRDVLLKRPAFENHEFPPLEFRGGPLKTDADLDLRQLGYTSAVKERLTRVLAIWGGDPRNLSDPPQITHHLLDAFHLQWPYSQEKSKAPKPKTQPAAPVAIPVAGIAVPAPPPDEAPAAFAGTTGFEDDLEAWATGALGQARANRIRGLLAAALQQRIDWNSLRMDSSEIKKTYFWLPYAQVGNPTAEPKLVVTPEARPVPATVRRAIAALDRWDLNGESWNYHRSEDDYAHAQALLDSLEQQAITHFAEKAIREGALLGRILHRQAILLGLSKRVDASKPYFAELVASADPIKASNETRELPHVGAVIGIQERAAQSREQLKKRYIATMGCFQGTGSSPHALDTSRAIQAWKFPEEASGSNVVQIDDVNVSTAVSELSSVRLPTLVSRYSSAIHSLLPEVVALANSSLDAELTSKIEPLLAKAIKLGTLPSTINIAQLKRSSEWLQGSSAREIVRKGSVGAELQANAPPLKQLAELAAVDLNALAETHRAISCIADALKAIQKETTAQIRASGGGDVADKVDRLVHSLKSLGEAQ